MPIITLEDVECPVCHEDFDLDDVDTDSPDDLPVTCPECGMEFVGQYDVATQQLALEEFEEEVEDEEDKEDAEHETEEEDEEDKEDAEHETEEED